MYVLLWGQKQWSGQWGGFLVCWCHFDGLRSCAICSKCQWARRRCWDTRWLPGAPPSARLRSRTALGARCTRRDSTGWALRLWLWAGIVCRWVEPLLTIYSILYLILYNLSPPNTHPIYSYLQSAHNWAKEISYVKCLATTANSQQKLVLQHIVFHSFESQWERWNLDVEDISS